MTFEGAAPDASRAGILVEARALVRLAAPIVVSQVGLVTMGFIDTVMVGHASPQALAAVATGNIVHWGLLSFGLGVLFALDPLVSQAWGAGDRRAVSDWFARGLVLATVLSLPLALAFQFAAPVLRLCHQPAEIVPSASAFVRASSPGVLGFMLFTVFRQTLQAMHVTRPIIVAVVVGNLSNLVLNYLFIFGHAGFAPRGAVGAAMATSISRFLMAAVAAWLGRHHLRAVWSRPTGITQLAPYGRMLALGLPVGAQVSIETWVFVVVALLMGNIGTLALTGHQVAIQMCSLTFMVAVGVGSAASVRVGNAIGRGDRKGARLAALASLGVGVAVMSLSALAFAVAPRAIAHLFSSDAQVVAQAAMLLPIAALFQISDGTQGVSCGVLRGAADTRVPALAHFAGYWLVGLPIGLVLAFRVGLGPRGLWWGLTLGLSVVALILVARVRATFRR